MRTLNEIADEVAELKRIKPLIPQRTMFGDSNANAVEIQITVLSEQLDEETIFDRNEGAEQEDELFHGESQLTHALEAARWLHVETETKPSTDWLPLVRKA